MPNILIYDCEIVNMIPAKREAPVAGIQYCKGWTDFQGMGISVIGAYDYRTQQPVAFLPDEGHLQSFQRFIDQADVILGFNNHGFDDPLVRAHGITFRCDTTPDGVATRSIDLRVECLKATGVPMKDAKYLKGFSLPALAGANFGMGKAEEGALAPIMWQRGERQRVIDYCLNDIEMTKRLVDRALEEGWLYDPRDYSRKDGAGGCGCVPQLLKFDLRAAIEAAARRAKGFELD